MGIKIQWNLELPNFAAWAVLLRVAVIANASIFLGGFIRSDANVEQALSLFIQMSVLTQPVILLSLATFYLLIPRLSIKGKFATLISAPMLWVLLLCWGFSYTGLWVFPKAPALVLTFLATISVILYLDWRQRSLSPAILEARLYALQAKMRPHFFFNALNGIVVLLGKRPQEAEDALLNLADLFRAMLKEGDALVTVSNEITLIKKYLDLEKMRFAERLDLCIRVDKECENYLIPSLLIQPLLENAVMHGIEKVGKGRIELGVCKDKGALCIRVSNPALSDGVGQKEGRTKGNKMALKNIVQRLDLLYQEHATLRTGIEGQIWVSEVRIEEQVLTKKEHTR